jgi:hypothetical protein
LNNHIGCSDYFTKVYALTYQIIYRGYYELNLESISVNGQDLPIDPSVFRPSSSHKTIVDSGTTFTYLADAAFDPFVDAVISAIP